MTTNAPHETTQYAATHKFLMIFSRIGVPVYALFVSYCAMVPFGNWVVPDYEIMPVLLYGWVDKIFVFDIIQNLLLYLPLGFFAVFSFKEKYWVWGLIYAFVVSLLVCTALEILQAYNPARVSSALDVILNTLSGFIGGAFAAMFYQKWIIWFNSISNMMHESTLSHPMPFISLMLIISWGAYHWYPFLPTLHPGFIEQGYAPLVRTIHDFYLIKPTQFLSYFCQGIMLYALTLIAFKEKHFALIASFVAMILPFKILLIGRVLSFEAIAGTFLGLFFALLIRYVFARTFSQTPQLEP